MFLIGPEYTTFDLILNFLNSKDEVFELVKTASALEYVKPIKNLTILFLMKENTFSYMSNSLIEVLSNKINFKFFIF